MRHDVVVVGAGHAGLALSAALAARGIEHVVLERDRVGATWRTRWDSFRLVTPNWAIDLPGGTYDGDEPDGYMPRDEIVAFLERYADGQGLPVRAGVEVTGVRTVDDGFELDTSDGSIRTRVLAAASGGSSDPTGRKGLPGSPTTSPCSM